MAKFISLPDFTASGIARVVNELVQAGNSKHTLAVVVIPREMDQNEEVYVRIKAALLKEGIASQFCTRELTAASRSLQWASANLALGVFAKIGGTPWRVESTSEPAVILGVAQAVDWRKSRNGTRAITRQIAYSVLTDSTGEFKKLDVLADVKEGEDSTDKYLAALKASLIELLRAQASGAKLVVVHIPFRPRGDFIAAIKSVVEAEQARVGGSCEFCVVKINDASHHPWFGYLETANSMVPMESTLAKIDNGEYLLWFEGQDAKRRLAKKRYAGPTHIRFLTNPPGEKTVRKILDDLVDLAGANWRGFNARSEPVSVYYCHLVASFMRNCRRFGVELPNIENLNPWFL